MSGLSTTEELMWLKEEVTEGTDSVPTSANTMLVQNLGAIKIDGQKITRNIDKPYFGADPFVYVGKHISFPFEVELTGAGTAGDAPPWAPIALSAGFAETLDPGTDARYNRVSTGHKSFTCYRYVNRDLWQITGVRCKLTGIGISVNGYPLLKLTAMGRFSLPTDAAIGARDGTGWRAPVAVTPASWDMTIDGYALKATELNLDAGVEINHEEAANDYQCMAIVDSQMSGSVTYYKEHLSAKDYYAKANTHTPVVLDTTVGATAGDIVQVTASSVQQDFPEYGDKNKSRTQSMNLTLLPTSGNDELVIIVK